MLATLLGTIGLHVGNGLPSCLIDHDTCNFVLCLAWTEVLKSIRVERPPMISSCFRVPVRMFSALMF